MISRSIYLHPPVWSEKSRSVLIFFITGNPGLIAYYEPFLTSLRELLDSSASSRSVSCEIALYGEDLAGFNDADHQPFSSSAPPFDLQHQVGSKLETLDGLRIPTGPRKGERYDDVIIMGHSVGTFITLQIFQALLKAPNPELNLRAGILLFATVEHLAQSPTGVRLNSLLQLPILGSRVPFVCNMLLSLAPYSALHWFIRNVMRFSPHGADATAQFLKSRDGVWQALHLGRDELKVIAEDKWDQRLWEVEEDAEAQSQQSGKPVPKFFFFFGRNDHWVANHLRDDFIEKRSKDAATRLVIDEGNIPHDFCIHHSEVVADKVKTWVNEIYS